MKPICLLLDNCICIKKKDKREIANKLTDAVDDEIKREQLAAELRNRDYSKAA